MNEIHWTEIVFVAATFVVLTAYHLFWVYQTRRAPLETYAGEKDRAPAMSTGKIIKMLK